MNDFTEALKNICKHGKTMTTQDAETIIEALEKQIPKKPYNEGKVRMTWYSKCLTCNKELPYVVWNQELKYCPHCGQALDWS